MKKSIYFFILLSALFLSNCSKNTSIKGDDSDHDISSLEVRLLRTPGVFIQNGAVRIRGNQNSFSGNSEPLFEINGQVVTGGYEAVKNMVSPMEIKSIRVLKNPDELTGYGVRGMNGVIRIKLKGGKG